MRRPLTTDGGQLQLNTPASTGVDASRAVIGAATALYDSPHATDE